MKQQISALEYSQKHFNRSPVAPSYYHLDTYDDSITQLLRVGSFINPRVPSNMIISEAMYNIRGLFAELLTCEGYKTINNETYDRLRRALKWLYLRYKLVPECIEFQLRVLRFNERVGHCNSKAKIRTHCRSCDLEDQNKRIVIMCQNRYHDCCAAFRFKKAYARLCQKNIRSKRLIHAIVGFKRKAHYFRADKKNEEYVFSEFVRSLKRQGYVLKGLKIFDFQDDDDSYTHFHLALLPVQIGSRYYYNIPRENLNRIHSIRKDVSQRLGTDFTFRIIGIRPKKKLFHYFAKRMAGLYGDGKKYVNYTTNRGDVAKLWYKFTLSDRMDSEVYVGNFYRVRSLTHVSRRLSCTIVPVSEWKCPNCGFHKRNVYITIDYVEQNKVVGCVT